VAAASRAPRVLKDATLPADILAGAPGQPNAFDAPSASAASVNRRPGWRPTSSRTRRSRARSTCSPSDPSIRRSVLHGEQLRARHAYLALGAPVGEHADWTARAALTQGDLASWIVAGEYTTRAPAQHRYDVGLSYSTQRYEGGNSRLAGRHRRQPQRRRDLRIRHVFDLTGPHPHLWRRYARYDYLESRSLISRAWR